MLNISNEAKEKYKGGIIPKEMVVSFPNEEHSDIHNDEIVAESLEFQENLVKGEFKFGLCQANYLKFETVADVSECTGAVINISIFIDGTEITLGKFTIDSVSREDDKYMVSAYGDAVVENQEWNAFELGKRYSMVFNNVPYTARLDLLLGNQAGYINLDGCALKKTITSMVNMGTIAASNVKIPQRDNASYDVSLIYGGFSGDGLVRDFPQINEIFKFNLTKSTQYNEAVEIANSISQWAPYSPFTTGHIIKPIMRGIGRVDGDYYDGNYVFPLYTGNAGKEFDFDFTKPFYPYLSGLRAWTGDAKTFSNSIRYGFPSVMILTNRETRETERIYFFDNRILEIYENPNPSEIVTIARDASLSIQGTQKAYFLSEKAANDKKPKILNDYYELHGLLGRATRSGDYQFIELEDAEAGLYPSNNIYPGIELYPTIQNATIIAMSEYEALKMKADREEPFGAVFYDYLASNNQKAIGLYQFDENYSKAYYIKDNSMLNNVARTPAQINAILDESFIPKLRKVAWTKSTLDSTALPWLESGDPIAIKTKDGTFATYIFNRTLKGIQSAMDNIDSDVSASDTNVAPTNGGLL